MILDLGSARKEVSAELAVLLRLIGSGVTSAGVATPGIEVPAGFDWDRLLALADRHGLYPQLAVCALAGSFEVCPPDVRASLQAGRRMRQLVNVVLERRLLEILEMLGAAGIAAIALKGPVLDHHFFSGARLRQYSDIDIWIAPHDVARAVQHLKGAGFTAKTDVVDPASHPALRYSGEMMLTRHVAPDLDLDLHWRLFDRSCQDCPRLGGFDKRLQNVAIEDRVVPTLGEDDLLLYLCYHAGKHGFAKLAQVQEAAMQLARIQPLTSAMHYETARRERRELPFALGAFLASRLSHVPIPHTVETDVMSFDPRGEVLDRIVEEWERTETDVDFERVMLRKMQTTLAARGRSLMDNVFIPRVADWQAFPLDGWLAESYFVLRPLRLVHRSIDRGVRSIWRRSRARPGVAAR